ncbi:MAG: hypothetical protein Q9195_006190 [Heterodermia aff. obscurata]
MPTVLCEGRNASVRRNLAIAVDSLPQLQDPLPMRQEKQRVSSHQLQEEVLPGIKLAQKSILGNTAELADSSAHAVAFHRGLGTPLHPISSSPFTKYVEEGGLKEFSQVAYAKDNFAVVANGASHSELSKWVNEFFTDSPDTAPSDFPKFGTGQTKYYGGEERIAHDSGNNIVLAFPGSGSVTGGFFKPEISVLRALLGGQTTIKWSPGFSLLSKATEDYSRIQIKTTHHTYSDAGLLCISMSGDASQLRKAASGVVSALKGVAAGEVSKEDIKKAVATAKFQALESGQAISTGIELTGAGLVAGGKAFQLDEVGKSIEKVTEDQVKKAAKSLLDGKATVSTVGDFYNRYLAVAARVVRRSLKEEPRLQAERRGEMDLRFAKWQVSGSITLEETGN